MTGKVLKTCFVIVALNVSLIIVKTAFAAQTTIVETEANVCMGDDKSRKQTESAAMVEARKKAAENVSTLVVSETQVKDYTLQSDLLSALANAEVRVLQEIEKGWYKDLALGDCYHVKLKVEVVPDPKILERFAFRFGDVPVGGAQPAGAAEERQAKNPYIAELERMGIKFTTANFLKAVIDNNERVAELFVKAGVDVNTKTDSLDTALIIAARNKNERLSSMILAKGANPDSENNSRERAITVAADNGLCALLKELIRAKAQVRIYDDLPLRSAASRGHFECVRGLIDAGVQLNTKDAFDAAEKAAFAGHFSIVKHFFERGLDPLMINKAGRRVVDEMLHRSVYNAGIEQMSYLLTKGANIDSQGYFGHTPVMLAVERNRLEVLKFLISRNANVNIATERGTTAVFIAVDKKKIELLRSLLAAKADLTVKDQYGFTPLQQAVKSDWLEGAEEMAIDKSAINALSKDGSTALLIALEYRLNYNENIIKALLKAKADPSRPDKNGETPLMRAVENNNTYAVELLAAAGAALNAKDKKGDTALLRVFKKGSQDTLEALLKAGADANIADKDGATPLQLAIELLDTDDALRLLIKHGARVNEVNRKTGKTPLFVAVDMRKLDLVKTLMELKADPKVKDRHGRIPADAAREYSWKEMVDTLEGR